MAIVFLAALLVGLWLPTRIIISTSASLDHRVFFMTSQDTKRIKDGDYLVFRHHDTAFVHPGLYQDDQLFIKKVGCSAGETLRRNENNHFFCGQKFIGKALTRDSKGRDLLQFTFNGEVPENNYFMVGSNPRSFDSKYFGFIHADEIIHKALPLW
jgi:signal peptidase I